MCGFAVISEIRAATERRSEGWRTEWLTGGRTAVDISRSRGSIWEFRRLAIIDLQSGNQPVYNEDRSLVLTFNGEIYNYRELRKILLARGHFFYTESDSEVLVHAYEEWGENMLRRLRGMFAFCIYDRREKGLFLARDFFGIKPLHYMECGGHFVYGSEIKSLLEFSGFQRQLNERTLERLSLFSVSGSAGDFLSRYFLSAPRPLYEIPNGTLHIRRYWEPVFCPDEAMPLTEAADRIEAAFEDSVKAHRVSDVEVGCFLSSGVDSSWAASYFSGQKAFTVGFAEDSRCNEIDWAQKTAAEKNLSIQPESSAEMNFLSPCRRFSIIWTSLWRTQPA